MILKLIKFLHDKIAAAPVSLVALAMVVGGFAAFEGMVLYNQTADFCQSCHINRGPYQNINLDSVAHKPFKDGQKTCLDCHNDKDFHHYAKETVAAGVSGFSRLTNPLHYDRPELRDVSDAQCLDCHNDILRVNRVEPLDVSPTLAKIGLAFSHERHFEIKEFGADEQERYALLQAKTRLDEKETQELAWLEKVRIGHCAQCHERNQLIDPATGERRSDRTINFYSTNPAGCSGCHVDAIEGPHPGFPLDKHPKMPTESDCRRCHNGRVHGRLAVFPADCSATQGAALEHCQKCHPDITPGIHKTEKSQLGHLGQANL